MRYSAHKEAPVITVAQNEDAVTIATDATSLLKINLLTRIAAAASVFVSASISVNVSEARLNVKCKSKLKLKLNYADLCSRQRYLPPFLLVFR